MKKKILVIRLGSLKGFIHAVPFFKAIREHHKNDEITVLTEKEYFDFCKSSGFFDKGWVDKMSSWYNFKDFIELSKRIRHSNFDFIYDLQNDTRSDWYFRLSGFKKPKWNSSVTHWCSHPFKKPEKEKMNREKILASQLSVAGIEKFPELDFSQFIDDSVTEKFELPENYIVMCPAGNKENIAHKWDPEKYSQFLEYIEKEHGLVTLLLGLGNDDYWLNANVSRDSMNASPINLSGKLNVTEMLSICAKAKFCIGNDTAPAHVAAFSGVKTIMICSRFSPAEEAVPKIPNLAIIEEPFLENLDYERVEGVFEEFILPSLGQGSKGYKVMKSEEEAVRKEDVPSGIPVKSENLQ